MDYAFCFVNSFVDEQMKYNKLCIKSERVASIDSLTICVYSQNRHCSESSKLTHNLQKTALVLVFSPGVIHISYQGCIASIYVQMLQSETQGILDDLMEIHLTNKVASNCVCKSMNSKASKTMCPWERKFCKTRQSQQDCK